MRVFGLLSALMLAACGPPPSACAPATASVPAQPTAEPAPPGDAASVPRNASATEAREPVDPKSESIGGFSSGTTSDDVISKLGEPDSRPARVEEGASGEFVVSWKWQAQGILLEMASPSADGPLSVRGLSIRAPSQLKTSKGIGIGASRADVERAYQGLGWKAGDDGIAPQPNEFLIGTVYGGTRFRFDGDAKVESIEVGAWAE